MKLLLPLMAVASLATAQAGQSNDSCHATVPNGVVGGSDESDDHSHGNTFLSIGPVAGLWPNGTVIFRPGGAGFVTRDGALGMKFGWQRGARGKLRVTGRRLDGDAPPLRSDIRCCYGENGEMGFQATYLIFPTPGCWEVTAQVGDHEQSKLIFVTKVVQIGEGPLSRYDPR